VPQENSRENGEAGRGLRCAVAALGAVLVVGGVVQGSASAEGAPEQTADRNPVLAGFAHEIGINYDEAVIWFELQEEAEQALDRLTKEAEPSFSGLWLDRGQVMVGWTRDADAQTTRVREWFSHPHRVHAAARRHSAAEGERLVARIAADIPDLRRDRAEPSAWYWDAPTDRVVLGLPRASAPAEAALENRYGKGNIRTVDGTDIALTHDAQPCANRFTCTVAGGHPWRAGVEITSGTTACTSGFWVRNASYTGSFFLTAGHCGASGSVWRHAGQTWGPMVSRDIMWALDGAVIRDDTGNMNGSNTVFHGPGNTNVKVNGIYVGTNVPVGTWLCTHGRTTGGPRCGSVINGNLSTTHSSGVAMSNQVYLNLDCAQGGDSGSPAYGLNSQIPTATAYAIIWGSSTPDNACDNVMDTNAIASYIRHFENWFSIRVPTAGVHGY